MDNLSNVLSSFGLTQLPLNIPGCGTTYEATWQPKLDKNFTYPASLTSHIPYPLKNEKL